MATVTVIRSIHAPAEVVFRTLADAKRFAGFAGLLLTLCASFVGPELKAPMFYVGCTLTFICLLRSERG